MAAQPFSFRRVAVPVFAPSLLFGLGEGAILPVIPLTARELGGSVSAAAFIVALIGIGSLLTNIPASLLTMRRGERWAIVVASAWCALGMALCLLTHDLVLFAAGCFMTGMAQSVFNLARQSYLTAAVPVAWRARALQLHESDRSRVRGERHDHVAGARGDGECQHGEQGEARHGELRCWFHRYSFKCYFKNFPSKRRPWQPLPGYRSPRPRLTASVRP